MTAAAPLRGRRVLVTRPRAQAEALVARLEAHGAEVLAVPTIRLDPPEDWEPLDAALRQLERFRVVVFTSVNGVAAFRDRLARAGGGPARLRGAAVAAIGPETGRALRRMGVEPDVLPAEYRAEGLRDAILPRVRAGDRVLLVRAAEARDLLPRALEASGARVTVAPAYRTALVRDGREPVVTALRERALDAVAFTSSSTVRGFVAMVAPEDARALLGDAVVAAIGPITAATARAHGLSVAVTPHDYTIPALADAIAMHFQETPSAAGRG